MIKIICNRCNKEIAEQNVSFISIGTNVNPLQCIREYELPMQKAEFSDWHFCPDCINKIKSFIKSNPQTKEPQKETPEPPKAISETPETEQTGRKRIDRGKIMALKNAGWSNAKIADEMDMTANSVAQVIYQCRKKKSEGA